MNQEALTKMMKAHMMQLMIVIKGGIVVKQKKILLLGIALVLMSSGCQKTEKQAEAEIITLEGKYGIDVNSYPQLAGDADYVIIGNVVEELGVEYRRPVTLENEGGTTRVFTKPYTNYYVQIEENLKGNLSQNAPITVTKRGGISEDGETCILSENDILPVAGNTYIFFIYAQEDGSNLASGPNSTIPVSGAKNGEMSTRSIQDEDGQSILEQVRIGVDNQIVMERDRSISKDDVGLEYNHSVFPSALVKNRRK